MSCNQVLILHMLWPNNNAATMYMMHLSGIYYEWKCVPNGTQIGVSTLFLFFGLICFFEIVKITHYASILSHYASIIFIVYYTIAALRKSLCSLLSEFVWVWLKEFARREKIR